MNRPQLWLLVGGNGAGKTTFFRSNPALRRLPFINADRIARRLKPHAPELAVHAAAAEAEKQRERFIRFGVSFCAETVFSHPSKVELLQTAKARGYEVNLIYIHLPRALHAARVIQRVSEGGHDVPPEKIAPRVDRLRERVKEALPICDFVAFYDNSNWNHKFERVLSIRKGHMVVDHHPLPCWALKLTGRLCG